MSDCCSLNWLYGCNVWMKTRLLGEARIGVSFCYRFLLFLFLFFLSLVGVALQVNLGWCNVIFCVIMWLPFFSLYPIYLFLLYSISISISHSYFFILLLLLERAGGHAALTA